MAGTAKPRAGDRLSAWEEVRSVLLLVRDIRAADKVNGLQQRRVRLRKLARQPYFHRFRTGQDDEARGTAICATVFRSLRALRQELPPTAKTSAGLPEDKAILLWFTLVVGGLSLQELSADLRQLFDDAASTRPGDVTKRAMRMRGLMWHPGNHPRLEAQPGIEKILHAVQFAFDRAELASSSFDWEWERLQDWKDQQQLLTFLCYLAPGPVHLTFVCAGAHVLPSPLRRTFKDREAIQNLLSILDDRGLLKRRSRAGQPQIALPKRVRDELRDRITPSQRRLILDQSLRFLTEALPPDTHFFMAWPQWRANLPQVHALLTESAEISSLQLRRAHLLDRRSVFFREADQNTSAALADSRAAVELAEAAGAPNPGEYAIYLGNLAIAEERSNQWKSAVGHFDQALAVTKECRGSENDDYAETLSLKANALHHAGRISAAGRCYAEAEQIIRRVYAKDPDDTVAQVYRAVLNDHASFLLRHNARSRPRDRGRARKLLDEVALITDQSDHGWFEVHSNLAQLTFAERQWQQAYELLEQLLTFCESNFGEVSLQTFATLRDLTDAAEALGLVDKAREFDLRAHEIDDKLAAADDIAKGGEAD